MTTYIGTSGNDTLSGGSGPDQLRGGRGNDRYYITEAVDRVVDAEDEGDDRIFASVSYVLRAGIFVETLSTADARGNLRRSTWTGNEIANMLYGNAGAQRAQGRRRATTFSTATPGTTGSTGEPAPAIRCPAVSATTPTWSTPQATGFSRPPAKAERPGACASVG